MNIIRGLKRLYLVAALGWAAFWIAGFVISQGSLSWKDCLFLLLLALGPLAFFPFFAWIANGFKRDRA